MKVILTNKVKSLGSVGEVVNVSQGFARNYLIPNKLALLADDGNKKQMADYQKMLAKKVQEQKNEAQELAKKVQGMTVLVSKKVGGNGRLFGTVTPAELSKELEKEGVVVEKRLISIDDPIKTLGSFTVKAVLFKDVEASFNVKVEMDAKQANEEKRKQEEAALRKAAKAQEPVQEESEQLEATEQEEL